ncbi:Rrf2 family transcriptional regulator [Neobacillus mesonae]|nr:Rrf2 family transcriptional regulator [Neobacillus mesonae]
MITSRFSVGIHILTLLDYNKESVNTSEFIAASVGTNPVVIRRIMGMLNKAGLVEVKPGVAGAKLKKDISDITLLDIYHAVHAVNEDSLFSLHDSPNPACDVGRNIQGSVEPIFTAAQKAMEDRLAQVKLSDIVTDVAQKSDR